MFRNRFLITLVLLTFFVSPSFFAKEIQPSKKEIQKLTIKAENYLKNGDYEKSLIIARLVFNQSIKLNNNTLIANCYNTIAGNYEGLNQINKAILFYNKGLNYANKTSDNLIKYQINNNLGNTYCFQKNEYTKGIDFYKRSIRYSKKLSDSSRIIIAKLNIAWAYFDKKDFSLGLPHLQQVNEYYKKHRDSKTIVLLNMLNGMYYSSVDNYKKANYHFVTAIEFGKFGYDQYDLSITYKEYSAFLLKNKEFEKAYKNLAVYLDITDEIYDQEVLKDATVLGFDLQLEEYKRQIDKIESEYNTKKALLTIEQTRDKKIIAIMTLFFIISSILFYFSYQNNILKQRSKLSSIRSKIQENTINATLDGQEKERKKIASFLHDNISALLSAAGMHLTVFITQNQGLNPEIEKTKAILAEAHDKIRDLSHQLIPSLLIRFGLFYALEDLCEKNSNTNIQFDFVNTIPENTRFNEEFEMKMYFIISELLNNIIKHSEANSAKLTIEKIQQQFQVVVWDDGKGFYTTNLDSSEGFGINQIRARVKNMEGKITIDSAKYLGTTITICTPILERQ
jgi:two-component system NarL family sensor kinase